MKDREDWIEVDTRPGMVAVFCILIGAGLGVLAALWVVARWWLA